MKNKLNSKFEKVSDEYYISTINRKKLILVDAEQIELKGWEEFDFSIRTVYDNKRKKSIKGYIISENI